MNIMAGIDLKTFSLILGYSSIGITTDTYVILLMNINRKNLIRLIGFLRDRYYFIKGKRSLMKGLPQKDHIKIHGH